MPVQVVNFAKLFGTLVAAALVSVAIIMALSQATGYNLYTGDELQSSVSSRIQENLQNLDTSGSSGIDTDSSSGTYDDYLSCLGDPDTTAEQCATEYPDEVP